MKLKVIQGQSSRLKIRVIYWRTPSHNYLKCFVFSAQRGSLNHPFHLHGYSFAVLDMGVFKNGSNLDSVLQEFQARNLSQCHTPPFVDTLGVPSQGYAIVRFKADNPGKATYDVEGAIPNRVSGY